MLVSSMRSMPRALSVAAGWPPRWSRSQMASILRAVRDWASSSCSSRATRLFSCSRTAAASVAKRARSWRARTRSVTSRRMTEKTLPWRVAIWEMDASIGNSLPSARRPQRVTPSPPCPLRRVVTPVAAKRRTWSPWPRRNRSGMSMDRGRPMTCAAGQPKVCSAARLYMTMCSASSMLMMASMAESRSAARLLAASASFRREKGTCDCGRVFTANYSTSLRVIPEPLEIRSFVKGFRLTTAA